MLVRLSVSLFRLSKKCRMSEIRNLHSNAGNSVQKYSDYIKFMELVGNLKHLKRTGWVMRNVNDPESIAGHMYRMAMIPILLSKETKIDTTKSIKMALVHDLAESVVGDITPFCGTSKEDKRRQEFEAMEKICELAGSAGSDIMELFLEYEDGKTEEAKFVKDLDRFDMILQAFEYEKRENCPKRLQEFFDSTQGKFQNETVINLVNELNSQREEHKVSTSAEQTNSS